jgi:unsaturated rhamnogalacturonyl hydrolase
MTAACKKILSLFVMVVVFGLPFANGQTWVDSLDIYARESYMPPGKYVWTWQRASLLRTIVYQYEVRPENEKAIYFQHVRQAMAATEKRAHGIRPNAVASGHGMAFLWRITGDERYRAICEKIYGDYLSIIRTPEGGVSHKTKYAELWDDTIFMIGVFLLEMFRATGEEKYIEHLVDEIRIHREKLLVEEWGLWVHGWDADNKDRINFCGKRDWADETTRRSSEIWGRGNGWVIVTLSDAVKTVPAESPYYAELAGYLAEMVEHLPYLQDGTTGHWYQLPVRKDDPENWIESSCTAMFAYGILTAMQHELVFGEKYLRAVNAAYRGLRRHSIVEKDGAYLSVKNVCKGTCCGDRVYYLNRKSVEGKYFGLAMPMLFGITYEKEFGLRP